MMDRELEKWIKKIRPLDAAALEKAGKKWNSIAKPLHSLGKLERAVIQIAGIPGNPEVTVEKKALLVLCADNGVVEEGVTQTGQEVTAIVAENFLDGNTSAAIMCQKAGVDLFPVDVGMAKDTKVRKEKVSCGTKNFCREPAMSREEALETVFTGIRLVSERVEEGYDILATGEMGIGNTTTSSAVASVLLDQPPELLTGRGAGLSGEGLKKKKEVIKKALSVHRPDRFDPLDVLAKVGGFDLAGLTGVFLGSAIYRIPVVIDGFISAVAALAAVKLCPGSRGFMLASHSSREPGMRLIMKELQMEPPLDCEMCLGEGTGAVAFFPVLDLGVEVYHRMSTFSDNNIEEYRELGEDI